jgi:predicted PurR-regulated permease PerM
LKARRPSHPEPAHRAAAGRRPPAPPLWVLVLVAALLLIAYRLHEVLVPFALSLALGFLLNPLVNYLEVRGLRRSFIIVLLYCGVFAALMIAANLFFPAVSAELDLLQAKVPGYYEKAHAMLQTFQEGLLRRLPLLHSESFPNGGGLKLYQPVLEQLPKVPAYVLSLVPLFSLLFLVPFITFFVLLDAPGLLHRSIQLCPSRYVEQALHVFSEVETSLGNYIRGLLILMLAISVVSYFGLLLLGVNYALAIATLSGVASVIPYGGAVLGIVVGALVAFFQYNNIWVPLQVAALFIGIRLADEALLQPFIAKHSMHLHPMVFLLALLVGGKLFGFVGLLFAVPAACVVKALVIVAWDWYASETQTVPRASVAGARLPYV